LGIDKDVLRQSVFVRQTEVESVLFDDPRDRELAFQRLVGLGDAAKHQKFLTDFLSALAEPKNLKDEIARQTENIAQQGLRLKLLMDNSRELEKSLATAGDGSAIRTELSTIQERVSWIENAMFKAEAFRKAEADYNAVIDADEVLSQEKCLDVEGLTKRLAEISAQISRNVLAEQQNAARRKKAEELQKAKDRLAAIPEDWEEQVKTFNRTDVKVNELRGKVAQLDKLLKDAPDSNVCPLCGSTTKHNIRAEIQRERDETVAEGRALSEWLGLHMEIREWPALTEGLKVEIATTQGELDELGPVEPVQDIQSLRGEYAEVSNAISKGNEVNSKILGAKARLDAAKKVYDKAAADLNEAMAKIPGNHTPEELAAAESGMKVRYDELLATLDTLSKLQAQKAELDGGIRQVQGFIEEAKKGLEDLRKVDADNEIQAKKIAVIKDVKDWFSYKNGPRVMSQAVMSMLVDETNKFLGQFGAPFTVTPIEEGMGFRCLFTDGRVTSEPPPEATMLSGGQKIALAVAFRFAVYMTFAGKLGLLSLDEPTAYLDDETIARFADLLTKIREIAANMGLQILLATHEHGVMGSADQTIQIGA
jgi:exonuclease SbcC